MLSWTHRFGIFCFLDNQDYTVAPHRFESLLAAGARRSLSGGRPEDWDAFIGQGDWCFGHLSYELKDQLHGFASSKRDPIGFPLSHFFIPEHLLLLEKGRLTIHADDPDDVYAAIEAQAVAPLPSYRIPMQRRLEKASYVEKIRSLQKHIRRGDCYEINFCQEFFAEDVEIDPVAVFRRLTALSPNPFSALYRFNDAYLICASPERYLTKKGNRIFSQPMKGTIRRDRDTPATDALLRQTLVDSSKDRAENVMVVDLVRNDLSRICERGSVGVDELFGVYAYPQVHQMISTVSGTLRPEISFSQMIQTTFPMGSMTGAPKHRVMELIDAYEGQARGLFSGSVGYLTPEGDGDWNVVIRSLLYNAGSGYLSYQAGSGITTYSDPELEWEECLLKGAAIQQVLTT